MLPAIAKTLFNFYFLAFLIISNLTLFHCQINSHADSRCPKISNYEVLPQLFGNKYTELTSSILKYIGVYFFQDFVNLMSPEAVHILVYSGIFAVFGQALMFMWGCIYYPYKLARQLLRYSFLILIMVAFVWLIRSSGTIYKQWFDETRKDAAVEEALGLGQLIFKIMFGSVSNPILSGLLDTTRGTMKKILGFFVNMELDID